jgi:hypothetical protein
VRSTPSSSFFFFVSRYFLFVCLQWVRGAAVKILILIVIRDLSRFAETGDPTGGGMVVRRSKVLGMI